MMNEVYNKNCIKLSFFKTSHNKHMNNYIRNSILQECIVYYFISCNRSTTLLNNNKKYLKIQIITKQMLKNLDHI